MKKLTLLLTITLIAVFACLSGCSFTNGNKFTGTWEYKSYTNSFYTNVSYITIERKGDKTFIVNHYWITPKGNLGQPNTVYAELKENILVTQDGKIIDIDDGVLTYPTKEFRYTNIDKKVLNYHELSAKALTR